MIPLSLKLFTWKELVILIVLTFCKFVAAVVYSLQAPFYPAEAETKNATSGEYGFVFGLYELTSFLVYPFVPLMIEKVGQLTTLQSGLYILAGSTLLFGFVNRISTHLPFLFTSMSLRVLEAFGASFASVACYSFVSDKFSTSLGTVLGIFEAAFNFGIAFGPGIGGFLYELPVPHDFQFTIPFITIGLMVFTTSIFTYCILSTNTVGNQGQVLSESKIEICENSTTKSTVNRFKFFTLLKIRKIQIYTMLCMTGAISNGFLLATLEPHLRQFNLSKVKVGGIFLLYAASYAISTPIWGYICDHVSKPLRKFIPIIGSLFVIMSFIFLGPAKYIPIKPSLSLTIGSLVAYGIGVCGVNFSVFLLMLKSTEVKSKLNNDESSISAIVSSLWLSTIAFGTFIGPSVGGYLVETIRFEGTLLLVIGLFITMSLTHILYNITRTLKTLLHLGCGSSHQRFAKSNSISIPQLYSTKTIDLDVLN